MARAGCPPPLPSHFLRGFDDQRIETEGVPKIWFKADANPGETVGYSVYLDGVLRDNGWWYYYLALRHLQGVCGDLARRPGARVSS